jgi:ATP-dependent DNA helicase RecG
VDDLSSLIARGMTANLHWFPEDFLPARLATVLVGMANHIGGTVLIGIAPRSGGLAVGPAGEITGVTDLDSARDRIFQAALMAEPPLVLPLPRTIDLQVDGKGRPLARPPVLSIHVPAGLPHVYALNGRYLNREGVQTNPIAARKLRQLLIERGVVQFESRIPPGATYEDLDPEQVGRYLDVLQIPGSENPREILFRRGCLQRVEGELYPTYAALLLFGRYPQQWLPNATLSAARFPGLIFSDLFIKREINGTLPDQLRQAEMFLQSNLRQVVRMSGLTHQETQEYPLEAARELLANAVAHRDYNLQGDNIHLFLFADRMEVHSPGGLPGPVNLQNLLEARFSRNAVIMQVLSDLGFVERLGYGLKRVVTVLEREGLRLPRFEEMAGTFRVTLFNDLNGEGTAGTIPDLSAYLDRGLNDRQQKLLVQLVSRKRVTNRDYQELCPAVHAETLRRDLADLVSRGILLKIGDKRATYYIFKRLPGEIKLASGR